MNSNSKKFHNVIKNNTFYFFNPDFEEHGCQSTHTIVEVLHKDVPVLVDSIRMELNRREM